MANISLSPSADQAHLALLGKIRDTVDNTLLDSVKNVKCDDVAKFFSDFKNYAGFCVQVGKFKNRVSQLKGGPNAYAFLVVGPAGSMPIVHLNVPPKGHTAIKWWEKFSVRDYDKFESFVVLEEPFASATTIEEFSALTTVTCLLAMEAGGWTAHPGIIPSASSIADVFHAMSPRRNSGGRGQKRTRAELPDAESRRRLKPNSGPSGPGAVPSHSLQRAHDCGGSAAPGDSTATPASRPTLSRRNAPPALDFGTRGHCSATPGIATPLSTGRMLTGIPGVALSRDTSGMSTTGVAGGRAAPVIHRSMTVPQGLVGAYGALPTPITPAAPTSRYNLTGGRVVDVSGTPAVSSFDRTSAVAQTSSTSTGDKYPVRSHMRARRGEGTGNRAGARHRNTATRLSELTHLLASARKTKRKLQARRLPTHNIKRRMRELKAEMERVADGYLSPEN